jgi:hypothetical protein
MRKQKNTLGFIAFVVLWLALGSTAFADPESLSGTVVSAKDLTPIAGITMALENTSTKLTTTTDINGNYVFDNLPEEHFKLYIHDNRYISLEQSVTIPSDNPTSMTIVAIPIDILCQEQVQSYYDAAAATISGKWVGKWRSYYGSSGSIRISLSKNGSKLNGTLTVTNTDCGTMSAPLTGSINGDHFSGKALTHCRDSSVRLRVKGTLTGPKDMTGNYWNNVDGSLYDSGTYTAKKK